ncbi:MAG: zinc ribbon domain-containing protein [Acidiferrobacterales bacterium]
MSIFRKDCPQCSATLPVAAKECGCGYTFASDVKRESQPSLAEIAHQERLYEEYLRVRAEHALQAARVAADAAALDPTDNLKAVQATLGKRAAETAQAALAAQAVRASQFNQLARSRAHGWQTLPEGPEQVGKR